jgi:hypothetical protein
MLDNSKRELLLGKIGFNLQSHSLISGLKFKINGDIFIQYLFQMISKNKCQWLQTNSMKSIKCGENS